MRSHLIRRSATFAALLLGTVSAAVAQARAYTPPPRPGYIYTVIEYAGSRTAPEATAVAVHWGSWKRDGLFGRPTRPLVPGSSLPAGIVLRLTHYKSDSIPVTVRTDGRIVRGPYQGEAPEEWTQGDYLRVVW